MSDIDKHIELRGALGREVGHWITVSYGPKTMGVGISGGPALLLARPGSGTDIEEVSQIVSDLCFVRNRAAGLLVERDGLLQELRNIANADTAEWDDPSEFEAWAKSRARAAITKGTGVEL